MAIIPERRRTAQSRPVGMMVNSIHNNSNSNNIMRRPCLLLPTILRRLALVRPGNLAHRGSGHAIHSATARRLQAGHPVEGEERLAGHSPLVPRGAASPLATLLLDSSSTPFKARRTRRPRRFLRPADKVHLRRRQFLSSRRLLRSRR